MVARKRSSTETATASKAKSPRKATAASHQLIHPSWIDMITKCITTTPEGTNHGVSRPTIKKFLDSEYHITMTAAATSQLNRAITSGTERGHFALPKGPSGKVKLAPNKANKAATENSKLVPRRGSTVQATSPASKGRMALTKRYTSNAKKARMTGKKVKQRPVTRRSAAREAVTGTGQQVGRGKTKKVSKTQPSKRAATK